MEISATLETERFDKHLAISGNSRILFSAPFGVGKSYFLRNYFKDHSKYNQFFLTPVDYVVGANQDIFEWIKIDLAKHLLQRNFVDKEQEKFSDNLMIQAYMLNKGGGAIERLLSSMMAMVNPNDPVGSAVAGTLGVSKIVTQAHEGFKKFKKEISEKGDSDETLLTRFIEVALSQKGSIFEDDLHTQIIRAAVEQVKLQTERENVLIIDDLDRLDPEHIFRILNIFSAHNNHFDTNKFGFDKVIVVCHYDNIQAAFQHRYGLNVDFEGYIGKFFTYRPFKFDIRGYLIEYCNTAFEEYLTSPDLRNVFTSIAGHLIDQGVLNVRHIAKIKFESLDQYPKYVKKLEIHFPLLEYSLTTRNEILGGQTIEGSINDEILKLVSILSLMLGGTANVLSEFENKVGQGYIHPNAIPSFAKIIGINLHIIHAFKHKDNSYFFSEEEGREGFETVKYLEANPDTIIFGIRGKISLQWNRDRKYKEGMEYFESADVGKLANTALTEKSNTGGISYRDLFAAVSEIVRYCQENRLIDDGVVTDS